MKDCYSVLRRQILEDVLGEKVDEYENFNKYKLNVNKRKHRKLIPLWKFLLHLLKRDADSAFIEWSVNHTLEFRIKDTASVAELWGSMKNKTDMTYEKLGRAMRYYYGKSIIEKVCGKRYSYRFILSRRTKKYISQFVNIKGMKIQPIDDPKCHTSLTHPSSHSDDTASVSSAAGSDTASVSSATGTSEEEEINLPSFESSPVKKQTPTSPINVKAIKAGARPGSYMKRENVFYKPVIQKTNVCLFKRNKKHVSAFSPPKTTKVRLNIEQLYASTPQRSHGYRSEVLYNRNQVFPSTVIKKENVFSSTVKKEDTSFDYKPGVDRNQDCKDKLVVERNQECKDNLGDNMNQFSQEISDNIKKEILDENEEVCMQQKVNMNAEMEQNRKRLDNTQEDCSNSSGSISSEDIDSDDLSLDYIENDLNENNIKEECDERETNCQPIGEIGKTIELKLNRHEDPFMGCGYTRIADYDRSEIFDWSSYNVFDDVY